VPTPTSPRSCARTSKTKWGQVEFRLHARGTCAQARAKFNLTPFPPIPYLAAVLLCAAAGMADAIGYVQSGVFAANMTGNTVLAGLALASGDWLAALGRIATLASFFAGAVAGRVLLNLRRGRSALPLGVEAVAIVLAAIPSAGSDTGIAILTFAMGVQSTALTRFHGVTLSTVVLTGTMGRLAEDAGDRLVRPASAGPAHAQRPARVLLWAWVAYGAGAALAALVLRHTGAPLMLPALAVFAVTALYARRPTDRAANPPAGGTRRE
jgi:uncharacterized membrane protein YoaK (UPF0700 family)